MAETHSYLPDAETKLGHHPDSADDIVVMVSDVIYDPAVSPQEAIARVIEILETPLALEIYENEMQRRSPRDTDRWH